MSTIAAQNLFSSGKKKQATSHLVEFKAGKLHKAEDNKVTADPRKGLFFMKQSDDGLLHLCWKDRKTDQLEDDLILFPDEAEWLPVPQCTTGRVYVLKFKTSSQRLFFWMQETKNEDQKLAEKVNQLISSPPAAGTQ